MISRIRVIALVGAGAISSASICSLYIAYTLQFPHSEPFIGPMQPLEEARELPETAFPEEGIAAEVGAEQSFLVAFLADADPQVRTLAAWGLMNEDEDRQAEILDFVRQEKDPEVRAALYRYLQGQRIIKCCTVTELVRQEKDHQPWLAGCDLLAGVVQNGASVETVEYFNETVVPELKKSAVNGSDLHIRIAAIIALRRAKTPAAVKALEEIIETAGDVKVVQAASSAVRVAAADR